MVERGSERKLGRRSNEMNLVAGTAAEGPETALGRGGGGTVIAAATFATEADGQPREEEQDDRHKGHPEARCGDGMSREVVHGVLDADQEPDVDAERDERDERRDEAEEGRDEHQGEVIGDREQEGEEGHDCRSNMSGKTAGGPGADRLDGTRAAQERCLVRVTGMDTLPCPILSEVHTISPDTETEHTAKTTLNGRSRSKTA